SDTQFPDSQPSTLNCLLIHRKTKLRQHDLPVHLRLHKQPEMAGLWCDEGERHFRSAAAIVFRRPAQRMNVEHRFAVVAETHDVCEGAHHRLEFETRMSFGIADSQSRADFLAVA